MHSEPGILYMNYDIRNCFQIGGNLDGRKTSKKRIDAIQDCQSTIVDKSPGTNLHFWRFWAHARRDYTPHTMLKITT